MSVILIYPLILISVFCVYILLNIVFLLLPLLLAVAFLTLLERKVMGSIQKRRGPNVVGVFGLFQPFADGIKLILKETVIPYKSNKILFFLAPLFVFFSSVLLWFVIPFYENSSFMDLNVGLLFILAISSLGSYGIVIAGWSSNSNYALLGSLRSVSQMISYEVSLSLTVLPVVILSNSLNLTDIVLAQKNIWFIFLLFPAFMLFIISNLAETNRTPFDLPEAEAELVSGYNVEYSAFMFALFFLAEYSHILLSSALTVICFFGGWFFFGFSSIFFFLIKQFVFIFFFIWVRASLPRYRFDQLMQLCWKTILPLSLSYFVVISAIFILTTNSNI